MTILRLLNPQGFAGLAIAACLALLLVVQKVETRHWRKQSDRFEALHREAEAARASIVADFAAAAEKARAADRTNADRVRTEQATINDRSAHDLETRIARARAYARRMREDAQGGNRGDAGGSAMPGLPGASAGSSRAPGEDRLPDPDRLIATEQAIQLDELIRWVKSQSAINPSNGGSAER